ncbi:hypothetical protein [Streptomyces sp. NPDC090025]|uniref:hypothetical protein n=1 Tax=Streptomyces sp. NPDC090025 TaxID=3365922 RepID=UPI003836931D
MDKESVSDEEWAAFVAAAQEQGLGTEAQNRELRKAKAPRAPKPPKAPKPPRPSKRQEPEGWRTGPAWREMNGRAARGRKVKATVGIVLVAALALVAVRPQLVIDRLPDGLASAFPDSWSDRPQDTTPLAAETAAPTAAPDEVDPDRPTLAEPFRGSPALRWADGAAGIEPPAAKAIGWMSKEQVAGALKLSKDFLVAANLDPAVLAGGSPDKVLKLIDPKQPGMRRDLEQALAKPSEKDDPTNLVSRFDPKEVRGAGPVVKVRGRMSVEKGTGERRGAVLVHTDYTFVFPLVKARAGAEEVARTIVRRDVTFVFYEPGRFEVTRGKVGLDRYNREAGNSDCRRNDGFFHPQFDEDLRAGAGAGGDTSEGPASDPYDRSKPLDATPQGRPGECGTATRT